MSEAAEPQVVRYQRVIHLSHVLGPGMPEWPGDPPLAFASVAALATHGYALRQVTIGEHSGTHVNAPSSFHADGAAIDAYPAEMLVVPAVVIDVSVAAAADADHRLTVDEVIAWERRFGPVPAGAAVLVHSGWGRRWGDPVRFLNDGADGRMHFPGVSLAAAELLIAGRGAVGLGIDTHGIDGGDAGAFAVNARVLERPRLLLENLANLDQLPP